MYDLNSVYVAMSMDEALEQMTLEKKTIINGGTDVLVKIRSGKMEGADLLDISHLQEISTISMDENGNIHIGAGCRFTDIVRNALIQTYIPFLAEACDQVGSPQIRNVATIGGNICNGAVSADSVPSLLVLNADLVLRRQKASRTIPLSLFHTGPGKTVRNEEELLTDITITKKNYLGYTGSYVKFGQRKAMEIATLSCAAAVRFCSDKKTIEDVRIAFGVAAPRPIRCYKMEDHLKGRFLDDEQLAFVRKHIIEELQPRDSWRASLEFREELISELSVRALIRAAGRKAILC